MIFLPFITDKGQTVIEPRPLLIYWDQKVSRNTPRGDALVSSLVLMKKS